MPFWNARDLERKLAEFQAYYNEARSHASLEGHAPLAFAGGHRAVAANLNQVRWVSHCRDLVQLPVLCENLADRGSVDENWPIDGVRPRRDAQCRTP